MRSLAPILAILIVIVPMLGAIAAIGAGEWTPAAANAANASAAPITRPAATPAPDNEAAAKHARRTACLKEAKTKKLVGAQKTLFIKDCIAAR
jgi:hypothetical protein